jgi:hypothetical protein
MKLTEMTEFERKLAKRVIAKNSRYREAWPRVYGPEGSVWYAAGRVDMSLAGCVILIAGIIIAIAGGHGVFGLLGFLLLPCFLIPWSIGIHRFVRAGRFRRGLASSR